MFGAEWATFEAGVQVVGANVEQGRDLGGQQVDLNESAAASPLTGEQGREHRTVGIQLKNQ